MTESPDLFVTDIRALLSSDPFSACTRRPELAMLGRTYATGYEPDLEYALIDRPRDNVLNPEWPWAIWYPLRRNGAFARLDHREQRKILMEHASIGRAYGREDYAHDVRLASYGLDADDNDFIIGLIGAELYPLSRVVQDMRKTQQTALYVESLGPFFVGKSVIRGGSRVKRFHNFSKITLRIAYAIRGGQYLPRRASIRLVAPGMIRCFFFFMPRKMWCANVSGGMRFSSCVIVAGCDAAHGLCALGREKLS